MTPEETIKQAAAGHNPFRTPEGYFEQFDARLMARLPRRTPSRSRWMWRTAAAVLVAAGLGTTLYWAQAGDSDDMLLTDEQTIFQYNDEALDYALVSNMEIEEYLAENY